MTASESEGKLRIAEFLAANGIGVLATSDLFNQPHAAPMYFVADPDLTVYFITREDTTKCRDLQQNPRAALAVYDAARQRTVQIAGTVTPVEDLTRIEDVYRRLSAIGLATSEGAVLPVSKSAGGRYRCFCLTPATARLADYLAIERGEFDRLFDIVMLPGRGE